MSTKTDYSGDEWKLVLKAPLMAGLAVVAASPSGPLGVLREMFAVGKAVAETKARSEGQGALLRALVVDLASPDGRASVDAGDLRGVAVEQLRAQALDACRAFAALVDRKASRDEADEVKRWLVSIAHRTAEAAKEGGVFGIGGVRVSEAETRAIRDVAEALGVPSTV